MALAVAGALEGTWLRADVQTGGRGRQGRPWAALPGNFYASTLVRDRSGDPPAPTLAFAAAVALHQVVIAYAPLAAPLLKWPNDVMIGTTKLSGILLEKRDDAVVIGFGVNLAAHPDDLDRPATSLVALGVTAPNPDSFLHDLAEAFAYWLSRWRGEGLAPVLARWLAAAHPAGTPLAARQADGSSVEGLFDGLAPDGALRLRLADGSHHVMHAGDVFPL